MKKKKTERKVRPVKSCKWSNVNLRNAKNAHAQQTYRNGDKGGEPVFGDIEIYPANVSPRKIEGSKLHRSLADSQRETRGRVNVGVRRVGGGASEKIEKRRVRAKRTISLFLFLSRYDLLRNTRAEKGYSKSPCTGAHACAGANRWYNDPLRANRYSRRLTKLDITGSLARMRPIKKRKIRRRRRRR